MILSLSSLVALATQPQFAWSTGLQPLRAAMASTCSTCRKKTGTVSQELFRRVVASSAFRADVTRLKKQLLVEKIQIQTDNGYITL